MTFEAVLASLLAHEGRYANHPGDPGKETYCGVSRRAHPHWPGWGIIDALRSRPDFPGCLDVHGPLQQAVRTLYLEEYWVGCGCDSLPPSIGDEVFDMAVHSGPVAARTCLQRALGVAADGQIGPVTRAAMAAADPRDLLVLFEAERLDFLTRLSTWGTFGKGWARRLAQELRAGIAEVRAGGEDV